MPDLRLNIGCGNDFREGFVNHSISKHHPNVDITHDLDILPWPWPDNTFVEVLALSVLEHLRLNLIEVMDELWRIMKPNGLLRIKHPLPTSPFINDDPTHRWRWSEKVWDFFDENTKYGRENKYYTDRRWLIVIKKTGPKKRNCWAILRPIK